MIALLFRGEDAGLVERAAADCGRMLEEAIHPLPGSRIQGPAPSPLARIKGVWRYQILLRSPSAPHCAGRWWWGGSGGGWMWRSTSTGSTSCNSVRTTAVPFR